MPERKAISHRRILIYHFAIIAAAFFLDLPMGLHVPGAERVIDARVVNAPATAPHGSRPRRRDGNAYRLPDASYAPAATTSLTCGSALFVRCRQDQLGCC